MSWFNESGFTFRQEIIDKDRAGTRFENIYEIDEIKGERMCSLVCGVVKKKILGRQMSLYCRFRSSKWQFKVQVYPDW